ncbi:MAG: VWA domain-containing protein, partial [Clostridia bacterium]|nr:VWA domain-containing protein [Clostridia bacterium]
MEKNIINFIKILRNGGIRVSLSEGEDVLNAVKTFGVRNKQDVYTIFKALMLKNEDQKDIFDLAWRICFLQEDVFSTDIEEKQCDVSCDGEKGTAGMNPSARHFYGLLRNRKGGNAARYIEEALRENDLPELTAEELAEQLKITLGWFMTAYALKQNNDTEGLILLNDIDRYLRCRCEKHVRDLKGEEGIEEQLRSADREERDFSALREEQVSIMEKQIARLGKKLASRYSYRLKPSKSGIPDMRRMMADTARRGHLPAKMQYLNKVKDRPDLIILCDISGSMGIYSSFCLQLVCAMERRFRTVRSFLFVDNIIETHFDFKGKTTAEAIAQAIDLAYPKRTGRSKYQCTTTGISDYGKAMEAFRRKFPDALSKNTTVIIVGDAKNNWFPHKAEELRDIRSQCNKLIWLNP